MLLPVVFSLVYTLISTSVFWWSRKIVRAERVVSRIKVNLAASVLWFAYAIWMASEVYTFYLFEPTVSHGVRLLLAATAVFLITSFGTYNLVKRKSLPKKRVMESLPLLFLFFYIFLLLRA